MADFNRSKSYSYSYSSDRYQMEPYRGPDAPRSYSSAYPNDFRSYSVSYSTSYNAPQLPELPPPPPPQPVKDWKLKKGKSTNGSTSKAWILNDPEFQRKRRVASYKVYSVEGKVKRVV